MDYSAASGLNLAASQWGLEKIVALSASMKSSPTRIGKAIVSDSVCQLKC
jgi:hypothetical protein